MKPASWTSCTCHHYQPHLFLRLQPTRLPDLGLWPPVFWIFLGGNERTILNNQIMFRTKLAKIRLNSYSQSPWCWNFKFRTPQIGIQKTWCLQTSGLGHFHREVAHLFCWPGWDILRVKGLHIFQGTRFEQGSPAGSGTQRTGWHKVFKTDLGASLNIWKACANRMQFNNQTNIGNGNISTLFHKRWLLRMSP